MSTLNDNDVFLVQQSGVTKTVKNIDRSTLDPEDRFLVQRNGVTHTIKSEDVGGNDTGSIDPPVAVLTPKNGAGVNDGNPYNPLSTAITNVGQDGDDTFTTDTIDSVASAIPDSINSYIGWIGYAASGSYVGSSNGGWKDTGKDLSWDSIPENNQAGNVQGQPYNPGRNSPAAIYTNGTLAIDTNNPGSWGCSGMGTNPWVIKFDQLVKFNWSKSTNTVHEVHVAQTTSQLVKDTVTVPGSAGSAYGQVFYVEFGPNYPSKGGFGGTVIDEITTLSFPAGATNFDKFEQGDVVQTATWGASMIGDGATSLSNPSRWSNGDLTNWTSANYNGSTQAAVRITFDPPIYNITSLRTATGISSSNKKDCLVSINWDGQGTPNKVSIGFFQWQNRPLEWRAWNPSYYANGISSIDFWNLTEGDASYTQNVGGIEINGGVVRGSGANYSISSINADATPPTIKVDGGNWYGADGTGLIGGATNISNTVTADASLTFTDDTELTNMVGPLTMVDENGDVKTPVTSTIANVSSSGVLSSITCQQGITSGSSAIAAIYLDGVILTSPSGSVTEGTFSNDGVNNDFSGLFDGNPNTVAFCKNSGRATYTFSPPIAFSSSLEIRGYDSNNNDKVLVNDQEVEGFNKQSSGGLSTVVVYGTTLTFESPNPELQYFRAGDVLGPATGFKPVIYRGNGVTQSITGVGFSPDLVWCKERTWNNSHALTDAVRGPYNRLSSDLLNGEVSDATALISFDSDGFTVGGGAEVNEPGDDYVAWCWDAGDTTVTNDDGTIESQVRSNGNFSIVKYTGNGLMLRTVGHGLSSVPQFIIIKAIDSTVSWAVMPNANANLYLELNGNNATNSTDATAAWYNTAPTSLVFTINTKATVNEAGKNYIAYCWAETPGASSFGSYVGNSQAGTSGPVITCGFKPAFILIKNTTSSGNWNIFDVATSDSTGSLSSYLWADTSDIEQGGSIYIRTQDTGFNIDVADGFINQSGDTFIYAAFAATDSSTAVSTDLAANQMIVDGGSWAGSDGSGDPSGNTFVTGPTLVAAATDVDYFNGNTLGISGVTGTWFEGLNAKGAEITATAPSPTSIVYTSANGNPLTTQFTGTDATLTTRTWTWQVSNAPVGPWTNFATKIDLPGQDGATPLADKPTLQPNKYYQVKVRYDSNNAEYVESQFNTFKTGDA